MPPNEHGPRGATRARPRLLLLIAGVLLLARIGTGIYDHGPKRPIQAAPDRVDWVPLGEADMRARTEHKPVLYDFTAGWCPPCRKMEQEVFADSALAASISTRFVPVRVTDRSREEGRNPAAVDSLQRRFAVQAFPTLVVYHPETGRHVSTAGYVSRPRTAIFLQNPSGGSLKDLVTGRGDSTGAGSTPVERR